MDVYLGYSFSQASPWPPEWLGHPWVLVSADDVDKYGVDRAVSFVKPWLRGSWWPGVKLLVDSGAYRLISKGKPPDANKVLEVQRVLASEVGALPVVLDAPVRDPLRATPEDYDASNSATARISRMWQREFGDSYVYVLHAGDTESLRRAIEVLKKTHKGVEYVGLGSLAPLSARTPGRVLELVIKARQLLPDKRLHVFGVGNGLLAALAHMGIADSADTASHIIDASFGMAREPVTLSMRVVSGTRSGHTKKESSWRDIASSCNCPICRTRPESLAARGREGIVARAVHNAYWMLRASRSRELALVMAGRRGLDGYLEGDARPVCIVSCSKAKSVKPGPAQSVYKGRFYRAQAEAAMRLCGTRWLILSGKHGLVMPEDYIEPYDEYLKAEGGIVDRIRRQALGLGLEEVVSLLPSRYHKALVEALGRRVIHISGNPDGWHQPIGRIIRKLKELAGINNN